MDSFLIENSALKNENGSPNKDLDKKEERASNGMITS